jgi:hypothetical protein
MRRGANLAISQWFTDVNDPARWSRAACVDHQHLPWTHDTAPPASDIDAMRAVCMECPVILQCAEHAYRRQVGGFYAGVWLPWPSVHESDRNRFDRHRARRHFRTILGVKMGRPPKHHG